MEWMNQNGTTVFLETNVGILFRRLAQSKSSRPLVKNLTDIELMEFIVEQTTIRQRFYKKSQHKISGDFSVEKNAEQLLKFLKALK
jgi:shikimate kinase